MLQLLTQYTGVRACIKISTWNKDLPKIIEYYDMDFSAIQG